MSKAHRNLAIGLAIAVVLVVLGNLLSHGMGGVVQEQSSKVIIIPVKAAMIERAAISKRIYAYGTVVPAPGAVDVLSVPYESYIQDVMANNGQMVSKGDLLMRIEPSQNTSLAFQEAKASYESERQRLQNMKQLMKLQLATNEQLIAAELSSHTAQLRLDSIRQQGGEGIFNLIADKDGLVSVVNVKRGTVVPAGASLLEIVSLYDFQINLGIEPEDMNELHIGQKVKLTKVYGDGASSITGSIQKLSYSINPLSRLVDISVAIPLTRDFLLGEFVQASVELASEFGLAVPISALLSEGDRFFLYVIKDGYAAKHYVEVGPADDTRVLVSNSALVPQDLIVISGNYELKDGSKVQVGERL